MISMVGNLLFTTEGTEFTETTQVSRSKAYAIWLLNQRRRDGAFTVIRNSLTMVPAQTSDSLTQMALCLDNKARLKFQPGFVTNCRNSFKLEPDFS